MFKTLDRYVLRQIIVSSAAMIGIALIALLLERLLRLLGLAANPDRVLGYISQMLVSLIPHYLGIALPLAFFLGMMLTFNRLSRDNELAVMTAAGKGLQRVMVPVLGLAFVLTVIAAVTFSYLQPLARYTYRSLAHTVVHASLNAAVKEATFVHVDGLTFIAENASADGEQLGRIFVYEEKADGRSFVTTASRGTLRASKQGQGPLLVLDQGERLEFRPERGGAGTLEFSRFQWPITRSSDAGFRARGKDERELTLWELWAAAKAPPPKISAAEAIAELHARLVSVLTILVLPFLAVPLSLGGGRIGQSYGIGVGLLILVVYEKVVTFGEAMAEKGDITPWLAIWLPFGLFALLGGYLFYRAAYTVSSGTLAGLPAPRDLFKLLGRRFRLRHRRAT